MKTKLKPLITEIKKCKLCAKYFEHDPRPVVQLGTKASILIAGQAPGRIVHDTGVPFDDLSGDRLRDWMAVSKDTFYDENKIAILPMGFCFPGTGKSGDLPPRPECAITWRQQVLDNMPGIQLILVIGKYAMDWHLGNKQKNILTETVKAWKSYAPDVIPLPHPSPRNNIWLSKNPWFESEVLPALRKKVRASLNQKSGERTTQS